MRPLLLALSLAACGIPVERTVERRVASVCADGALLVATLEGCLSSSCDQVVSRDCVVERSEGRITLSAEATVEREQGDCTDDCGLIAVQCDLPADAEPNDEVEWAEGASAPLSSLACTGG